MQPQPGSGFGGRGLGEWTVWAAKTQTDCHFQNPRLKPGAIEEFDSFTVGPWKPNLLFSQSMVQKIPSFRNRSSTQRPSFSKLQFRSFLTISVYTAIPVEIQSRKKPGQVISAVGRVSTIYLLYFKKYLEQAIQTQVTIEVMTTEKKSKQMQKRKLSLTFLILLISFSFCLAQEEILYKQVDTTALYMKVYRADTPDKTDKGPAMVFFFGGGWNSGTIDQFKPHASYFSQRGITCFLVDYRVKSRQQTTPFESLKDAKSAIRYIRAHADEFNIDPSKIIASGGSAGGHLAAATALIEEYNESSDDLSVSCVPNALVLFNPVIDNGPGGYGYERIGDAYKSFSPLHNIREGAPPTILFLGTNDALIPVETVKYYQTVMNKVDSICELHLYEGQAHGFFNYRNFEYYKKTLMESDKFLKTLGFLTEEPVVEME